MIRLATENEASAIQTLFKSTIGGTQDSNQIQAWIASPTATVIVDIEDTVLRGAIVGHAIQSEAEIYDIAVHEDHRRRQIGSGLVSAFITSCRQSGVNSVFLEVRKTNCPAISLYRKLHFSIRSERPRYYPDGESALLLEWSEQ